MSAAQVYKLSPNIPDGEKYKHIAKPFENPPYPEKTNALISLPFSAIFTTNYDRSMHHSYAAVVGADAKCVELGDPTMDSAPFDLGFYIARIHGRAEVPESIVISESDYSQTETPSYQDFVRNCFTRYRCLFIGFSFLDPGIERIFSVLEERFAPNFPSLHTAIIPIDAKDDFVGRLRKYNINLLFYDAGLSHEVLWEAIAEASREYTNIQKQEKPHIPMPFASTQRFLSISYARTKMATELIPLRDIVIDGIILDIINSISFADVEIISEKLQELLRLPKDDCDVIVSNRTRYLAGYGLCQVAKNKIIPTAEIPDDFENDISVLVSGAINRLYVRYGVETDDKTKQIMPKVIESTLISRGWDLGASYLDSNLSDDIAPYSTILSSLDTIDNDFFPEKKEAIALACNDLFSNPSDIESEVLARLGRISFALQLTLNSPSSIHTHGILLPQTIYLDSNILMRAIVDGHPMRPLYVDTLQRLHNASNQASIQVPILVLPGFLNEVIRHRELAIQEVEELGLENPNELRHHIAYYSSDGANIFIAAYATWVGRLEKEITFYEFLNTAAPYNNVETLKNYLERNGVDLHECSETKEFDAIYSNILAALEESYSNDPRSKYSPKAPVLIENEAKQLAQLQYDQNADIRSLFVSGDLRLQSCCIGPLLDSPKASIISGRQFNQLVDLLLGLQTDSTSTARLLWGVTSIGEHQHVLNYLTDMALKEYSNTQAKTLLKYFRRLCQRLSQMPRSKEFLCSLVDL